MRLFLLFVFFAAEAHAFRLDPMVNSLTVASPNASGTFTVENTGKAKMAVQFEVRKRVINEAGKEERPAAEGFLVYPEQISLEPGEKRNVRVAWTGENIPTQELAYRFIATQLPVDFQKPNEQKTNLRFLVEYVAALYLAPVGAKPDLKVKKTSFQKGILEATLVNEGTAHQLLDRAVFTVKDGKRVVSLSRELLSEMHAENILAGSTRVLKMNLPKSVKNPTFEVNPNP
jgi:fimbrial chaperone protein